MSVVSEEIVREYFEALGFFSFPPTKYQVSARAKRSEEEIDLVVVNSRNCERQKPPKKLLWGRAELLKIPRAIVSVRGWHTERFGPSLIEGNPEICRFASEETMLAARTVLKGDAPILKVLCLPGLPASKSLRDESIAMLREKGVDGVLLFKDILLDLAKFIDISSNYGKSDLLQLLRILKNYDLLKDSQMELFDKRNKRRGSRKKKEED